MPKYRLHDVFLSYRRFEDEERTDDQGAQIAKVIYEYLESKGLNVFWDQPEMETGSFVDQLQWQLEHSPNYIFIGTESAKHFRQVTPPDKDYVAEEVRYALRKIHEQESLPNPRRDRVVLHIIPKKYNTQKRKETKGVLPNSEPYPEEIQELLNTQQGVELDEELPSEEKLKQILKYVTQVNRGNMWNAGSHWLEQATTPGKRFSGLRIIDTLMPQATVKTEEVHFPILAYQEGESPQPLMNMINNTKGNLYLIGTGGIGKTTALFRIMEEAYKQDDDGRVERNRMNGQIPLFVELSGAPDVIPDGPSGWEWQVYMGGKSSFIHRAIFSQIRKGQRLREFSENSLEQIDEAYKMDYEAAVKPIVDLFSGETPAPEYLLLLDGLNEISRREIKQYKPDGELSFKRSVVSMVIEEIKSLMQYKNVRVILTSRSREAANWTEYATILDLSGVETDTIKQYLLDNQVSEARLQAALNNDRLREVLQIPLFLILYGKLKGEEELLTAGEILHLFFHQKKQSGDYTQSLRTKNVHQSVFEASEGYEPASRLTPQMIGFILDFIVPRIGWEMLEAQEFHIRRDRLGDTGIGLDEIIEDVLTNTSPQSICGQYGAYAFEKYSNETDGDTAAFAENMVDQLGGMKKAISAILYCIVMTLGVLYERNHEFGFTHHHLRDYFAAVHQINQLKLAVYLQKRGKNNIAHQCLADWREHPLHSEVRRFIGEALDEAHNAPICDEQGNWHYTVPNEPCNRNLIKRGFDIYRGRFEGQDMYCVWNLLEIMKNVRQDLSGEDFSSLNLIGCEINGHSLGKRTCSARLDGAQVNDDFFMPKGHTEDIYTACYSPDGRRIVTASADHTAKVWDAETLQVLGTLNGHSDTVNSAIYSPNGNRIITASRDKTAIIWDAETLQISGQLKGHNNEIKYACFSRNGDRIVTVSLDGSAIIWDAKSRDAIYTLKGENAPQKSKSYSGINFACFSPDGNKLVTASEGGVALIWNMKTFEKIGMLKRQPIWVKSGVDGQRNATYPGKESVMPEWYSDWVNSHSVNEDKYNIIIYCDIGMEGIYEVIDRETLQDIGWLEESFASVNSANYSPDGKRIITANDDGTIVVWDAESLQEIETLKEHNSNLSFTSACYSPDGCKIVAASPNGVFTIWDADTFQKKGILRGFPQHHFASSASYSPNGRKIVTAGWGAKIWQSESMQEVGRIKRDNDSFTYACYSLDNQKIITTSTDGTALLWDALTFRVFCRLKGHSDVIWSANFSSDSRNVVTASQDSTAKIWDAISSQEIGSLKVNSDGVFISSYSPDKKLIVTISHGKVSCIWDAETFRKITTMESRFTMLSNTLHPGFSYPFSPDGLRIIIGSDPGSAKIWDVKSFKEIGILKGCSKGVQSANYSPNGCKIITGSGDTIEIWDAVTLQKIDEITCNAFSPIISVCYSPDGLRILSVFMNGTLKIWDAEDKKEVFTLKDSYNACYSSNGNMLVTVSDGKVKIRNAHTFECLHTIFNVPGLEVYGVDLRHLHDSELSDEVKERLFEYGAIVDARG